MNRNELSDYTVFNGPRHIASGDLREVARQTKTWIHGNSDGAILIFDNATSQQVEIDFRGSLEEVLARLAKVREEVMEGPVEPRPGRPKLGVIAREVTLLPRHWEWLAAQRGGASVSLRRLVEEARRASESTDQARQSLESLDRFLRVMAGDFPGYEEATRWLYRKDRQRFEQIIENWPADVRIHLQKLAEPLNWQPVANNS